MDSQTSSHKRICLHCPQNIRKPILVNNFTRHMKEKHHQRYAELTDDARKWCSKPEQDVDYMLTENENIE
jgi:hypothetical protein